MSTTPRSERSEAERPEDLGALGTTMMRHSRRIQRALGKEVAGKRPKFAVVTDGDEMDELPEIRPSESRMIAAYVKAHRRRDLLFSPGLFSDPAWEILLDLFVAKGESRDVAMDSVCLAAGVPASTAWRKFAMLEAEGLVTRHADPDDRRKTHVEVTPLAIDCIRRWVVQLGDCARD